MPSIHGEDAVVRVLDKETISEKFSPLSLEVVGFAENDIKKFRRYIHEPYGMVFVTGPTGSGKTTTLYGAISEIKSAEDKIITIEDPVEYQLRGITQIPVNEKKGLTFAGEGLVGPFSQGIDLDQQDHGGRDSGSRDGSDRHSVGVDRPLGLYDGSRQQCCRRLAL